MQYSPSILRLPISTFGALILLGLSGLFTACAEKSQYPDLPDPLEAGWQGTQICHVLEENEHVRALKCTFPPGYGHEKHYHPTHFGYTLVGGRFRITDDSGTREVDVPAGYDFYKAGESWHEVLNVGKDTAVFLIIEPK